MIMPDCNMVWRVQVDLFLEQWKMPDCGQKTLPLLHKLKTQAGIVEPKRDSESFSQCSVELSPCAFLLCTLVPPLGTPLSSPCSPLLGLSLCSSPPL